MLAAQSASRVASLAKAPAQQRRRSATVRATTQAAGADLPTPAAAPSTAAAPTCLLECTAAVHEKTKCVHPGRPVSSACPDCPRKSMMARMAKTKCVHPQRPISAACADCPRKK